MAAERWMATEGRPAGGWQTVRTQVWFRRLAMAVAMMVSAGCGDTALEETAGIEVWSLDEPSLRLGTPEGGPTAFSSVAGVVVGPGDELHVLLPQDFEVRVFDESGALVRSIGREGEGPGEFRRPARLGFVGDTLWVLDDGIRRASFFLHGDFVRSESYPPLEGLHEERLASVEAVLAGSSLLLATDVRSPFQPDVASRPGVLFRASGENLDSLTTIGVDHVRGYMMKGAPPAVEALAVFSPPFSTASIWGVSPDGESIAIVDQVDLEPGQAAWSVRVISSSGVVTASAVHEYDPIAIPGEHVDSLLDRFVGGDFSLRDVRAAVYLPETFPPATDVLLHDDGSIWVAREARPNTGRTWTILEAGGEAVAELEAPYPLDVLAIHGSDAWGVMTDEFDVPYLERRPIVRQ